MKTPDIKSAAYKADPFPALKAMLAGPPVAAFNMPIIGKTRLAVSYDAVMDVLKDQDRFAVDARNAGKSSRMGVWLPKSIKLMTENMLQNDEPDHRRLRKLADLPFHARNIEALRPNIHRAANDLLDQIEVSGEADLVSTYCSRLPLIVICEMLGIEPDDRDRFASWLSTMGGKTNFMMLFKFMPMLKNITAYLREEIAERRMAPKPGMITQLVQAEADGDKLSEDELLAMILVLFVAGHETTTHALSTSILTLLNHPDQLAELQADWEGLAPRAVEELLRFNSPVQMTKPRYARRDLELQGVPLKTGERIMCMLASANMDPSKFDQPERFNIHRENVRHVGFGGGIHLCLGIQLARTEMQVGLECLFTRFPELALSVPASQLTWLERVGMRGTATLPVTLHPALARAA